jgi:hypothetical protein
MPKARKRFQTKVVELSVVVMEEGHQKSKRLSYTTFFQNPAFDRESNPRLIF